MTNRPARWGAAFGGLIVIACVIGAGIWFHNTGSRLSLIALFVSCAWLAGAPVLSELYGLRAHVDDQVANITGRLEDIERRLPPPS
jgi:hypothetical protein